MRAATSLLALSLFCASSAVVLADDTTAAIMKRLDALERENASLRSKINQIDAKKTVAHTPAVQAQKPVTAVASSNPPIGTISSSMIPTAGTGSLAGPDAARSADIVEDGWYFRKKPGSKNLTFLTPGGEISAYGQFDVSLDLTTKGIGNLGVPGDSPVGNVGWQPALSTNLSYVGVRGAQKLSGYDTRFVYQMETQIDISATSGVGESNSNFSNVVKGGLTSRNSYIGLASESLGALKAGKTDAPYKTSTQSMNPFSGMLGDYSVIMGNSGGDNRVEFGTRLDHSIWYESPSLSGFTFAALYSPGQNRASNSDNIASGESDCSGGNSPVSGGATACTDGSFSDALSVSGTYKNGPLLLTAAYERHQKVNRSSDVAGSGLEDLDVVDEDARKIGIQLVLPTKTTVSAIYEQMHRYVPAVLSFQNERQRNGTWLAVTQEITPLDNISFGWAHAFRTPGDPGQHNTAGGPDPQNQADMFTAAYKHTISPGLLWYVDYAATINGRDAHYDLGAGGRGVTTDCHDATGSSGGLAAGPHCWAGGKLQGVSTGVKYNF